MVTAWSPSGSLWTRVSFLRRLLLLYRCYFSVKKCVLRWVSRIRFVTTAKMVFLFLWSWVLLECDQRAWKSLAFIVPIIVSGLFVLLRLMGWQMGCAERARSYAVAGGWSESSKRRVHQGPLQFTAGQLAHVSLLSASRFESRYRWRWGRLAPPISSFLQVCWWLWCGYYTLLTL